MGLVFTRFYSDSFQRADESPLNTANWPSAQGYLPGQDQLQILNGECTTTTQVADDGKSTNNAIIWPDDQWCEVTLNSMAFRAFDLYLRSETPSLLQPCYDFYFAAQGFGTQGIYIVQHIDPSGGTVTHQWVDGSIPIVFQKGDKIRVAILGGACGSYSRSRRYRGRKFYWWQGRRKH